MADDQDDDGSPPRHVPVPAPPKPPLQPQQLKTEKYKQALRIRLPRERLDAVAALLGAMVPQTKIQAKFAKDWGVPRKVVARYIKAIYQEWDAAAPDQRDFRRGQVRTALENMFMKASADKDGRLQLAVLQELSRLDGIYAADKVEVTGAGGGPIMSIGLSLTALGLSDTAEVKKRIAELKSRIKSDDYRRAALSQVKEKSLLQLVPGEEGTEQALDVDAEVIPIDLHRPADPIMEDDALFSEETGEEETGVDPDPEVEMDE